MKHLPIISGGNVSRIFKKHIKSALARVPGPAIDVLAADGWEIRLLPKADILFEPSLNVAASFAAASGTSYKKLRGATCMSGEHVLAFFETYTDESGITRTGPEAWISEDQIVHEIGHALDRRQSEQSGTSLSDSPDFIAAYRKDIAALSPWERKVFSYFIAGKSQDLMQDIYVRREVVAEGFSQILLDTKEPPKPDKNSLLHSWLGVWEAAPARPFREAFSGSLAVVEKSLVAPWAHTSAPVVQAQPLISRH